MDKGGRRMNKPTLTTEFQAFKNGVYDAIINGSQERLWQGTQQDRHYYKSGCDFGLTIVSELEGICHSFRREEE